MRDVVSLKYHSTTMTKHEKVIPITIANLGISKYDFYVLVFTFQICSNTYTNSDRLIDRLIIMYVTQEIATHMKDIIGKKVLRLFCHCWFSWLGSIMQAIIGERLYCYSYF